MVFLDVVYNHFGPEGNYLHIYAPQFFTNRHRTPWGEAINFDGPGSRVVRDFFIHNALYWLEEYHFDGLRFDAVHAIVDDSQPNILTELAQTIRESADKVSAPYWAGMVVSRVGGRRGVPRDSDHTAPRLSSVHET